jgi:CubicO group peptidase (beta-lactamase class C family)
MYLHGEEVIDLRGGTADCTTGRPWSEETCVPVHSCTKGLSALCIHMLADLGVLDFDALVARYWLGFAANGKAGVTVAMVLAHQAGLAVWDELLPANALRDWDLVTHRLAMQAPQWEPGTATGYHASTMGYLEGEIF